MVLTTLLGVVLLVDASEGPMAQTKFVLSKALAVEKKAIVVLNKVDRENHRAEEVEGEILDLFCALTSKDELLEYPLMYASAKQGNKYKFYFIFSSTILNHDFIFDKTRLGNKKSN
jgi:GTP-binding protein